MRKYDDELTILVMIRYDNKDNNDENDYGGGGSGMIILIMREEAELIQATTLPHALHCAATFTTFSSHPIHCIAMCVNTLHCTTLHCTVHSYITMYCTVLHCATFDVLRNNQPHLVLCRVNFSANQLAAVKCLLGVECNMCEK